MVVVYLNYTPVRMNPGRILYPTVSDGVNNTETVFTVGIINWLTHLFLIPRLLQLPVLIQLWLGRVHKCFLTLSASDADIPV